MRPTQNKRKSCVCVQDPELEAKDLRQGVFCERVRPQTTRIVFLRRRTHKALFSRSWVFKVQNGFLKSAEGARCSERQCDKASTPNRHALSLHEQHPTHWVVPWLFGYTSKLDSSAMFLGSCMGMFLGSCMGMFLGSCMGMFLGSCTGMFLGSCMGMFLGSCMGMFLGSCMGMFLGSCMGMFLGSCMGTLLDPLGVTVVSSSGATLSSFGHHSQPFGCGPWFFGYGSWVASKKDGLKTQNSTQAGYATKFC